MKLSLSLTGFCLKSSFSGEFFCSLKVYMSPDQMQKEQKQQQGDFAKDGKIVRTGMKADKQQQPQAGAGMRASNLLLTVPETDFTIKETNPDLGKAVDYNHHYGLVEQMTFLFIRVVKARGLAAKDAERTSDPVSLSWTACNNTYLIEKVQRSLQQQ